MTKGRVCLYTRKRISFRFSYLSDCYFLAPIGVHKDLNVHVTSPYHHLDETFLSCFDIYQATIWLWASQALWYKEKCAPGSSKNFQSLDRYVLYYEAIKLAYKRLLFFFFNFQWLTPPMPMEWSHKRIFICWTLSSLQYHLLPQNSSPSVTLNYSHSSNLSVQFIPSCLCTCYFLCLLPYLCSSIRLNPIYPKGSLKCHRFSQTSQRTPRGDTHLSSASAVLYPHICSSTDHRITMICLHVCFPC